MSRNITFYKHPVYSDILVVLDTSIFYNDVYEDKYFLTFLKHFIQGREVVVPSVALYELFTNPKWKKSPPTFVRQIQEFLFIKDSKIETIEPISILTLLTLDDENEKLDNGERRKSLKKVKRRSRAIRDITTLLTTVNNKGILVTADEDLHRFASALGIPSLDI